MGLHYVSCTLDSRSSEVNIESSVLGIFFNGNIPNSFARKIVLLQRLLTKFSSLETILPTLLLLWILVPPHYLYNFFSLCSLLFRQHHCHHAIFFSLFSPILVTPLPQFNFLSLFSFLILQYQCHNTKFFSLFHF